MTKKDFGKAFDRLMDSRDNEEIAAVLDLSAEMIRKYRKGISAPADAAKVFEIERRLELAPGELSVHLGFVPIGRDRPVPRLLEVIDTTDELDDLARRILRAAVIAATKPASAHEKAGAIQDDAEEIVPSRTPRARRRAAGQ